MPYGMYVSAAGAHSQSERLKILSHNLANVDTPGFKRELAVLQAQHAEAIEQGQAVAGTGTINDVGGGVSLIETVTDFGKGVFRRTGTSTDMAIDGEGFFQVAKEGKALLTRAGNFQFSSTGQLQTDKGFPVLSADGSSIFIDPQAPWSVSPDGIIKQAGLQIPLALVKPQSLGDLVRVGENMFSPLASVQPLAANERKVLGGYLEGSGVQPALEMMELIETSRAYEANVRMIQSQDRLIGSLVNRVLRS